MDFFDIEDWSRKISRALAKPGEYLDIRRQARRTIVERYDLSTVCLPAQLKLIRQVTGM